MITGKNALTRIGTKPFREILLPAAINSFGGVQGENGGNSRGREDVVVQSLATPGVRELLSTTAETMVHFISHLRDTHGGSYGYIRRELGMSEADIQKAKERLVPGASDAT